MALTLSVLYLILLVLLNFFALGMTTFAWAVLKSTGLVSLQKTKGAALFVQWVFAILMALSVYTVLNR